MSWRRIIAFADGVREGAEDALVRTRLASALARQHSAHLEVVLPTLMPMPVHGTSVQLLSHELDELRRRCHLEARVMADRLRATAAASEPGFRVSVEDFVYGGLRTLTAALGRTGDVVVLGQPDALDGSTMDTEIFLGALFGSGRPCLMLPRWTQQRSWGRRALVAWKAGPEAARALAGALPLLRSAKLTRILIVSPDPPRMGEDDKTMARISDYLHLHGIDAELPVRRSSDGPVEAVLAEEIEAFDADLLVMGAYGRPRAEEIVFGGVSAAMIRRAQLPVLLAH